MARRAAKETLGFVEDATDTGSPKKKGKKPTNGLRRQEGRCWPVAPPSLDLRPLYQHGSSLFSGDAFWTSGPIRASGGKSFAVLGAAHAAWPSGVGRAAKLIALGEQTSIFAATCPDLSS